jgi:outer membrane protein TolC
MPSLRPHWFLRALAPVVTGAALLLAPSSARGAGADLTLAEAVSRALREGADAKLARIGTEQANAAAGEARSIFWPHAAVTSNAGWSDRQNDTIDVPNINKPGFKQYPLSALGSNEAWLSMYIDQVLFDLSRWHGVERTHLEHEVAAVQEAQQRESISYAVTEQYVRLVRLQRFAALDAERVTQLESLDQQSASILEAGRALPAERDQVALALEDARIQQLARHQEVAEARAVLWQVIGGAPDDEPVFEVVPQSVPTPSAQADPASDAVLRALPELRILDLRRRMEEESLKAARAERYPTLSMRGGYFHYGTKRFDAFETEVAVGVDLTIPVFDGFKAWHAIEGASQALEAAQVRYDATRATKRARLQELARQLNATAKQPELADRRARLAVERRRLADLALQGQRGTVGAALTARSDADAAARAAVDATYDRVLLWANLEREAGMLATLLAGPAEVPAP